MDARAVLEQAVQFEERAAEFYRSAATDMADPVLRALLSQLADIEVKHVASVRRACADMDAPGGSVDAQNDSVATTLGETLEGLVARVRDELADGPATYTGIYETALDFERKAAAFYRRAASDHPDLKGFFARLASVEALHVEMFKGILDANRSA